MTDREAREVAATVVASVYIVAATEWLPPDWWRIALSLAVAWWVTRYAHR